MRLLFITTKSPASQGDFLEVSILHGLRSILGDNCVDYPRKDIMYHDFRQSPKESLHGKGFSLLTTPIEDISNRNIQSRFDAILYGDGHIYGEGRDNNLEFAAGNNVWFLDGHDLYGNAPNKIIFQGEEIIGTQFDKSFKRELTIPSHNPVFPTGFGIPKERIRVLNVVNKTQLFQQTAPTYALFGLEQPAGMNHHVFDNEQEYYRDLSQSWFGLTCKKGGWDCLRHYEIIAAGACLLFRDYDKKPHLCSPQDMPCFSYSTPERLEELCDQLIVNNKPTEEYMLMLERQRSWLNTIGTTEARARYIIDTIINHGDTNEFC